MTIKNSITLRNLHPINNGRYIKAPAFIDETYSQYDAIINEFAAKGAEIGGLINFISAQQPLMTTFDGSLEQGYWTGTASTVTDRSSYRTKNKIIVGGNSTFSIKSTLTPLRAMFSYYNNVGTLISTDSVWNNGANDVFTIVKPAGTYAVNITVVPVAGIGGVFDANNTIEVRLASTIAATIYRSNFSTIDGTLEQGYWNPSTVVIDRSFYRTKGQIVVMNNDKLVVACNTTAIRIQMQYFDYVGNSLGASGWVYGSHGIFDGSIKPANTYAVSLTIGPASGGSFSSDSVISANLLIDGYFLNTVSTVDNSVEQGYWNPATITSDRTAYRTKNLLPVTNVDYININSSITAVRALFEYYSSAGVLISRDGYNLGIGNNMFLLTKPANTVYVLVSLVPIAGGSGVFDINNVISVSTVSTTVPSTTTQTSFSITNGDIEQGYWTPPTIVTDYSSYRTKRPILISNINTLYVACNTANTKILTQYYDINGVALAYDGTWNYGLNGAFTLIKPINAYSVNVTICTNPGGTVSFNSSSTLVITTIKPAALPLRTVTVSATKVGATYTSLQTCFNSEGAGNTLIILYDETHDCLNPFLDMKEGWTLRGVGAESTRIICHTDGTVIGDGFTSGFFARVNCNIENLTLDAYDSDVYSVHTDALNAKGHWDVWIRNCVLRRLNDTLPVFQNNTNGGQALGIGLGCGQGIHCINTQIIARPSDGVTSGAINLHNWANNGDNLPATYEFTNCDIIGKYGIVMGNFKTSGSIRDIVNIDNCNIEGGIFIESGGSSIDNSWLFNVTGDCPEIKTGVNVFSLPLNNGRKYLKNRGTATISKGQPVCYVYGDRQISWHQVGGMYNIPIGYEAINSTNYKYFAGIALNNSNVGSYGYVQTKDLVFIGAIAGAVLFDYLALTTDGSLVVDNTNPHYIAQIVRLNSNETVIKLRG